MKRWPLQNDSFWQTAPFFRILLPFAAGIFSYYRFGLAPLLFGLCMAACVLAAAAYAFLFYFKTGVRNANFLLLHLFFFCSGLSLAYAADARNGKNWFGNTIDKNSTYLLQVTDAPAEKENSWKVPVAVIRAVDSAGRVSMVAGNAFLYLYKQDAPMPLQSGDTLWAPGKWELITNGGNPFEFDYASYCRLGNVSYRQFCPASAVRLYSHGAPSAVSVTSRCHRWCMAQMDKYIPDPKTKGLMQAMLVGDEANLDPELLRSYADTGIVHIIAISGGNVAIFFMVVSWLLWWMKDKRYLWVKYAIALPLVWFYVVMAGAPPSAVRAAIMFSLVAGAVMLQKQNNSLNALLAAAFLLLCAQPAWLFAVGFQLSFLAVLSLVLFYGPVYKWVSPAHKITKILWGTAAASISAEVLVAPLIIYYFHSFPLLFLPANILAYLFMGLALILGIALLVVSLFLPVVAGYIGIGTSYMVTFFDWLVVQMQKANPESFHFLRLTGTELLLFYAALIGIVVWLMKKRKAALFAGLGAASVLWLSFCCGEWARQRQQRLVVFNIGHQNHIELIKGSKYSVFPQPAGSLAAVFTDSATTQKIDYAVKPAHIQWRAWQRDPTEPDEIHQINGKTVLVLNGPPPAAGHFAADYVVINYTGKIDLARLQRMFTPAEVIVGNNYGRRRQQKLAADGEKVGVRVHAVGVDGAFVVE